MPILNWIGKEAVVNHDKEVPFRLLKKVKSASVGENSQNLIINGDNLEGLKAIMPYYVGKIKCIYIDPPYNTGNEKWVYNDKVNSPKIKNWLGNVVGKEAEDLCRHDKWLCMMYPRLKLLRDLLSDDGVIFVSIDDNEQAHLKLLMDEVFGEENFIDIVIWKKTENIKMDSKFLSQNKDYVLCYRKTSLVNNFNKEISTQERFKLEDEKGKYYLRKLDSLSSSYSRGMDYVIEHNGIEYYPGGSKEKYYERQKINPGAKAPTWLWSKKKFEDGLKEGEIVFKNGNVYNKVRWDGLAKKPFTNIQSFVSGQTAQKDLDILFGKRIFDHPKPYQFVKWLVYLNSDKDSIILDSFAGSGTTGHAVLDLNKEDGGNRKFILIEMEDEIAKNITAERVKRAIKKYDYKEGFEYCELDKPLFNEDGQIDEECSFEQLATYIYFTETQTNIDKKQISKNFIGEHGENEIYLIYKEKGKNILNKEFLKNIPRSQNKKVIYADKCLIEEKMLQKLNIEFKQIPYEFEVPRKFKENFSSPELAT